MQKKAMGRGYHWVIVACCFLMIFSVMGFASAPRKLYMAVVPDALGIAYGPYSINDSIRYISTAIANLLFGALVLRFSPRKMIGAGFALVTASMLVYSVAEGLPAVYIAGALLGMGITFTGTTMSSYAVNLWCKKNKGTITGLVLCANGLGGALATQMLSPLINASTFGYRNAYRLSAVLLAGIGVLVVLFFRNSPQAGEGASSVSQKKAREGTWEGMTAAEAVRKPYFYAAAASIFLTGMVLQSIMGADATHMARAGLDKAYATTILSIQSLALAGFKFLIGMLYDRQGLKRTMLICDGAAILTMLMLIGINDSLAGRAMAAAYSLLAAMALPLETIMLPLITAEMFGQKSFAQMLGIVSAINTAGYAMGPPITNFIFDAVGTYVPVFWAYMAVMAIVTALFMYALLAVQREKEK